ncbi:conserved Plasmodium protein, unknown function [Plasmodium yoelii]|uniref:Uncharacterized protein n=2 Tax=Plasmodium yoelii TaxID=5861 RepID=A0AAE9X373_PLAYO|nr:conserved Plasmodium protein, unknown function [Plasmodium yoelii]WBY60983.1 hypothetical protein Py17XNL_001401567 [Plasmodium yoelii yoelii]CDU20734.1 conserved Plasmodium protein, unknown function [Plasmodium yoelii]VTZ81697.1 conserved Plasmodium protein, unknown function [Plasmodium yoelii]|eukprot:XP_022812955.1 conserved Plasmodium protein, unknown function [Plasmodium yoelii]
MPINVIIPSEPKNPSAIFKYERKDTPSGDLEGLLVLCFLGILIGVYFKIIEVIFMIVFLLISIYLTSNSGEINIMSILPMITMVIMTSTMSWLQQKGPNKT